MNQIERLQEAAAAKNVIASADRELSQLYKIQSAGEKVLTNKHTDGDTRAGAILEMETLVKRIEAVEDRRHQMRQLIGQLDFASSQHGEIKVISMLKDRCQVVIHYYRDNGKKMSYTRHLHHEGMNWIGLSTLTTNRVVYRLPGTGIVAEAA